MKFVSLVWAVSLAALPFPAPAQDAQTYLYDANGRLIATTTARTGANGNLSSYTLDDADNRVARTGFAVSPTPTANQLAWPYTMLPTQGLMNGSYTFTFDPGGLVLLSGPGIVSLWTCTTTGQPTSTGRSMYMQMTSGGDLRLYDAAFNVLWHYDTHTAGAVLDLSSAGILSLKLGATTLHTFVVTPGPPPSVCLT